MIYDISPPLSPRINVWSGDTPLSRNVLCDLGKGDTITLSSITSTLHLGSHADGPNHYTHPAPGIGERPLGYFLGPCQIIDAHVPRGARVTPRDLRLPHGLLAPRVLLRTGTFPNHESWNADFAGLSVELIDFLAESKVNAADPSLCNGRAGIVTIGVDTPSVDLQDSKDLPAHKAIARHDMQILEGLVLRDVPAGVYELIALPLKLMGCDASPVRAVLRPMK